MFADQEECLILETEKWETTEDNEEILLIKNNKEMARKLYPANQIIVKNYSPDVPLKLKLVTIQKKSVPDAGDRIQVRSPYHPQVAKRKYHEWDTLINYFSKRMHQLLYRKFENNRNMTVQTNNKTVNYLAGFFSNTDSFAKEESVCATTTATSSLHNIFEDQENVGFSGFHSNIKNSFKDNSIENDEGIKFSSNFESANLFAAFKKSTFEYQLVLQNDINSKGNTQWFYFAVQFSEIANYKFNIINFTKTDSLYNMGMKVAIFSYKEYEVNKQGWFRGGHRISYKLSNISREGTNYQYYTLHFEYNSVHESDTVIFANCFPYTYSDLTNFLSRKTYRKKEQRISRIHICRSLSGFNIEAIKLGDYSKTFQINSPKNNIKKKSLIFMARQHSGQTPASFVMEGVLDALIDSKDMEILKKQFAIYVIPMINPDGVFYGNYRTNLSGMDMNRKWRNPNRYHQPQIYYLKKFLIQVNRVNPIALIVDFHGHSRKTNSFFYGNPSNEMIFSENSKIFPLLCSKRNKRISYVQSTFFVTQDKTTTARVVLQQMFPHSLVYTFEASFYGFRKQKYYETIIQQFSVESYKKIGRDILYGYIDYMNVNVRTNFQMKDKLLKEISALSKNIITDDNGSDSEAEIDEVETITNKENVQPKFLSPKQTTKPRFNNRIPFKSDKLDQSKTIEFATQTDNRYQIDDTSEKPIKMSETCLSILRILPLSPIGQQQKTKKNLARSETYENLKTVRRSSVEIQKLRKKLLVRRHMYLEKSIGDSHQRLLYIKNIPMSIPESNGEDTEERMVHKQKLALLRSLK